MGIGAQMAEVLAAQSTDLVLVARSEDRLEAMAVRLRKLHNISVRVEPTDLTAPDSTVKLFDRLQVDGVIVDGLINNAGMGSNGRFWEQPRQRELQQIQLNVAALTSLCHLFVPQMVERGFGRILNIASTAGFQPGPHMAVYFATKAYVISFTQALGHELRGTGVTATAHCPGATHSNFAQTAGNDHTLLFALSPACPKEVATHAISAMNHGLPLSVHGWINRAGVFALRLAPRWLIRTLAARLNLPK